MEVFSLMARHLEEGSEPSARPDRPMTAISEEHKAYKTEQLCDGLGFVQVTAYQKRRYCTLLTRSWL